jgi:prepilin-type N-terminal cleavage/methylation domain-containing protein
MFKHLMKPRTRSGMTLIELMVVMGIMGILFAAVYMFFVKGTEQFHFTRRQNQLASSGKLILESMSDVILWAGYMPNGGWTEEEWKPVELATTGSFHFYADFDGDESLDSSDYRQIFRDAYDVVHITDSTGTDRAVGTQVVGLQFNYLDEDGAFLAKPLDEVSRKAVRHVVVKITLEDTYMGDVYQTVMQTIITPRNLGVYHNFDPLFYMPPPPDAKIVVNVDGDSTAHAPTADQAQLKNLLDGWGFTLVDLTDDQLESYEYDSSGVDLVILREIPGSDDHSAIAGALNSIRVPIIALDPEDAKNVFAMGGDAGTISGGACSIARIVPHSIFKNLPDPFDIYNTSVGTRITTLKTFTPNTRLVAGLGTDSTSGVSVIFEDSLPLMRIHYCAPEFTKYIGDGETFLYNVIIWSLPEPVDPPLGEEINVEGFEGDSPGSVPVVMWGDDLENGVVAPDSIPLYNDFGHASKSMVWAFQSTGSGEITLLADSSLQMHRTSTGGYDRNIAAAAVDLSAYNASTDDLYITVNSRAGSLEGIDSEDGVFVLSSTGALDTLVSENFETLVSANGDVTFWVDNRGRHRIHSPGWNNGTRFVTLDCDMNSNYSRSRMMIEVNTSGVADGTPITVYYRMADHGDETNNFTPSNNRGDYIGWSLGDGITDTIAGYENLTPGSKTNGYWNSYSYTFTPSGAMPSKLYIVFSQFDNYTATSATAYDGISFDDILIVADKSTVVMNRVGTPSSSTAWQRIGVDLDDAAVSCSVPFSTNFGIALSQYGAGPWGVRGIQWHGFELGVIREKYALPGWHHEAVTAGGTDDWLLEDVSGNHKWTLHANNATQYSSNADCWLESPQLAVPTGTENAVLSFVQSVDLENGSDYAWIEVSTDGGTSWNVLDCTSYNYNYSGHGVFTGTSGSATIEIPLDSYVGASVEFRFVFHSDGNIVRSGWTLDDFEVRGTVSGVVVQSIGFKPEAPSGTWYFNEVKVYLGSTTDDTFADDGEWDKNTLTYFGSYNVTPSAGNWAVIDLTDDFVLPSSGNLIVKLEMMQTNPVAGYGWFAGTHPNTARRAVSDSSDPTYLSRVTMRPAFMIGTLSHGSHYIDEDSTATVDLMPLSSGNMHSDFEAIYTLSELGFGGETSWVSGGTLNDWEIGVPLYAPNTDPALVPGNENRIAGTDLTDDGLYNPGEWSWLSSSAYPISDVSPYDSVSVSFDRCLRLASNDYAYVQMAFATSETPPTEESDWATVKECHYNDDDWVVEIIPLTYYFNQAINDGKTYYFIRFVLDSGPFVELGGWNIDNVGFYGRYAY